MYSRRKFLTRGTLAAGAFSTTSLSAELSADLSADEKKHSSSNLTVSLCGRWWFRTDPMAAGAGQCWFDADYSVSEHSVVDHSGNDWQSIDVPHTWQIDPSAADYRGVAWYRRSFDVPGAWLHSLVRIEFEAVFHTATIWVNGQPAGEHARKGYTAFTLDITQFLRWGKTNTVAVRVDSAFNDHMLPRGRSSDWAHDGGIYRPVQLLVTPKTFVERVYIEAVPDLIRGEGNLTITAYARNASSKRWSGRASFQVFDEATGLVVLTNSETNSEPSDLFIEAGAVQPVLVHAVLPHAKLWHFDHSNLYRLDFSIADEHESHQFTTTFGVRKLEVKDGRFHLNGEHVRLMGVERMAGSNPEFGMAEPEEWINHDHADMQHLNCIFTRVHWPQDKRVHEYCDRHGILIQTEVPAWGYDTFRRNGSGTRCRYHAKRSGTVAGDDRARPEPPFYCGLGPVQ
jgi:beta-glucuronidase